MLNLAYIIIFVINLIGMLVITLVIAALTLIERKFLALNQRRVGPYYVGYRGRLQYIADALKLFIKGVVIYDESNKFWFVAVPSICGLICYFFWVNSVWCPSVSIVDIEYNLVYATLLSISFSFCIILLSYFSGNKYTRLASIRSSLMVLNLELFLGLMILTTVLVTESFCFSVFVEYQKFWWLIFTYSGLLGLLCLVFLLEVGRTPFDLAEAESELVTGYSTEIGGFTFGIFYLGEYFHLFFFSSLMSIIFLGGWEYPSFLGLNYLTDYTFLANFLIKCILNSYLYLDDAAFIFINNTMWVEDAIHYTVYLIVSFNCAVDTQVSKLYTQFFEEYFNYLFFLVNFLLKCILIFFLYVDRCAFIFVNNTLWVESTIDYIIYLYVDSCCTADTEISKLYNWFSGKCYNYLYSMDINNSKLFNIFYLISDFLYIEILVCFYMLCNFFNIDSFYIIQEFDRFLFVIEYAPRLILEFFDDFYSIYIDMLIRFCILCDFFNVNGFYIINEFERFLFVIMHAPTLMLEFFDDCYSIYTELLARFCMLCDFFNVDGFYIIDEFYRFLFVIRHPLKLMLEFLNDCYNNSYYTIVYYSRQILDIDEPYFFTELIIY